MKKFTLLHLHSHFLARITLLFYYDCSTPESFLLIYPSCGEPWFSFFPRTFHALYISWVCWCVVEVTNGSVAQAINSLQEGWCWAVDIKNHLINYVCKQCSCLCLHASFLGIIIFVTIITIISSLAINSQSKNLKWNRIWELAPGHSKYFLTR